MSHVVVIGRTGQLARALAECAVAGAEVTFVGRDHLDLAAPGSVGPVIDELRPDLVVNAAAYTAVDRAEEERELAHRVNADAVGELAAAAARADAPFIHISTDYVYSGDKRTPYAESDATGPVSVYGASKLAGERAALAANPRTVILRTAWVYAPWGRNFLLTMLRLAEEREELRIVDDQRGSPTSALELAGAIAAIAPRLIQAKDPGDRGIFHYAGGGETSWAGFARAILSRAARAGLIAREPRIVPIPTSEYPTPATRPSNSVLDCTRFQRHFGLAIAPWETALDEVIVRLAKENAA